MEVPIIDVGPFLEDPSSSSSRSSGGGGGGGTSPELPLRRDEVARSIGNACQTHGFFYASGLDGRTLATIQRAVHQTKTFFDHPDRDFREDYKARCSSKFSKLYRGYTQTGGGNNCVSDSDLPELKESFTVGAEGDGTSPMHGPNLWPKPAEGKGEQSPEELAFCDSFRTDLTDCYGRLLQLSRAVARALAASLEVREDFFTERMNDPVAQLVGFRYPPETDGADGGDAGGGGGGGGGQISCGEHTDCGFLTLLVQTAPGLEVYARSNRTWHTVPPVEGAVLVNLGDLTQFWTKGRYKSTPHRVRNRYSDVRYSIVFFANCDFGARLDDLEKDGGGGGGGGEVKDDGESPDVVVTAGEYILEKLGLMWLMAEDDG